MDGSAVVINFFDIPVLFSFFGYTVNSCCRSIGTDRPLKRSESVDAHDFSIADKIAPEQPHEPDPYLLQNS